MWANFSALAAGPCDEADFIFPRRTGLGKDDREGVERYSSQSSNDCSCGAIEHEAVISLTHSCFSNMLECL